MKGTNMKLSFSTLGCPDWTFSEIFAVISDLKYDGVEIRGIADEIYAPKIGVFSDAEIENTKAKLVSAGLEIPILTSGAYLIGNNDIESSMKETKDYIDLARKLGTPYVRMMGEVTPDPVAKDIDFDAVRKNYTELCRYAFDNGVKLLLETNACFADTKVLAEFYTSVDSEGKGILWDIHHPIRYFNESPTETAANIGKYIRHVHIKDSVVGTNGKLTYMLTGYGSIPVDDCIRVLALLGYDGYLSYEWVKRWSRDLAAPGIAFYQYLDYMKGAIRAITAK